MRDPPIAALLCAVCYRREEDLVASLDHLQGKFGPVALRQPPYPFDHTDYYTKEMGSPLSKAIVLFESLVSPGVLPSVKLFTNRREAMTSEGGRRSVNLDPGYLTPAKVVLASTKNFSHRLFLADGIFGEVTLTYREGAYRPLPWTYPDYREASTLSFLGDARRWIMTRLRTTGDGGE